MDEIEIALNEMIKKLKLLTPSLTPSIFPSNQCIVSIDQLISNKILINNAKKWLNNHTNEPGLAFITDINYNNRIININKIKCVSIIDETLYSLEKIMKMLILGNEQELNVMIIRFLQVNGYNGNIDEERHIFYEAYNLAYSIKVICSNIPDLHVTFNDMTVPIKHDISINDIMNKYCIVDDKSYSDDDDDDNDNNDIDNNNDKALKKKRNRKRSKN